MHWKQSLTTQLQQVLVLALFFSFHISYLIFKTKSKEQGRHQRTPHLASNQLPSNTKELQLGQLTICHAKRRVVRSNVAYDSPLKPRVPNVD
jgi:hypothetical protein